MRRAAAYSKRGGPSRLSSWFGGELFHHKYVAAQGSDELCADAFREEVLHVGEAARAADHHIGGEWFNEARYERFSNGSSGNAHVCAGDGVRFRRLIQHVFEFRFDFRLGRLG